MFWFGEYFDFDLKTQYFFIAKAKLEVERVKEEINRTTKQPRH